MQLSLPHETENYKSGKGGNPWTQYRWMRGSVHSVNWTALSKTLFTSVSSGAVYCCDRRVNLLIDIREIWGMEPEKSW